MRTSILLTTLAWFPAACGLGADATSPQAEVANSIGMRTIRMEPGSFSMGSDSGNWDELPAHDVTMSRPFWISSTEVTNAQYEKYDPGHRGLRGKLGFSKSDDEAVVFVSWHEAAAFCRWLSEKEGKPYRLPTEAEWEYACRAGTTTPYHTGDKLPEAFLKNVGESWFPDRDRKKEGDIVPLHVGKTPTNPWGLFDMHGNVEEWCLDWYGPYAAGQQTNPVGPERGDFRVTRGGSHSTVLEFLRCGDRRPRRIGCTRKSRQRPDLDRSGIGTFRSEVCSGFHGALDRRNPCWIRATRGRNSDGFRSRQRHRRSNADEPVERLG